MLKKQNGFTLIELLIVVAIISLLAAMALPQFTTATDAANRAKMQAELRTIDSALLMYYAATGSYPVSLTDLDATYLTKQPKPPLKYKDKTIGTDYEYDTTLNRAYIMIDNTKYYADSSNFP